MDIPTLLMSFFLLEKVQEKKKLENWHSQFLLFLDKLTDNVADRKRKKNLKSRKRTHTLTLILGYHHCNE